MAHISSSSTDTIDAILSEYDGPIPLRERGQPGFTECPWSSNSKAELLTWQPEDDDYQNFSLICALGVPSGFRRYRLYDYDPKTGEALIQSKNANLRLELELPSCRRVLPDEVSLFRFHMIDGIEGSGCGTRQKISSEYMRITRDERDEPTHATFGDPYDEGRPILERGLEEVGWKSWQLIDDQMQGGLKATMGGMTVTDGRLWISEGSEGQATELEAWLDPLI